MKTTEQEFGSFTEKGESEESESEDDQDEILELLETMFNRKKTVSETMEMHQNIDIDKYF